MGKQNYNKTPLSIGEQITRLESRGLVIEDRSKAEEYLNAISPSNPPAWMCAELLTIGELSHIYRGLKNNADKKEIANFFGLHHTVFTSWLHSLTYVRNICAHHARLWNKDLAIEPQLLVKASRNWISQPFGNNTRTFYFLCVLKYLLQSANPGNTLRMKLETLFQKYPHIPICYMGIPSVGGNSNELLDWKNEALWEK